MVDRLGEGPARGSEHPVVAAGGIGGPFGPGPAMEVGFERGKQRVVVEPRPLRIGERLEAVAEFRRRPPRERRGDLVEQARSRADDGAEVGVIVGEPRQRVEPGLVDEGLVAVSVVPEMAPAAEITGKKLPVI